MIQEISNGYDVSILDEAFTKGLGQLSFYHPAGTFALTPASHILIEAIINHQQHLQGVGIDWGSGIGCLAILAARIPFVDKVYGLEIAEDNVKVAIKNAQDNGVADKVSFMLSDSYAPFHKEDKFQLNQLKGKVDFILSNPPSSSGDDGFGFRRAVLEGAAGFLKPKGVVLMNSSFQYGIKRVESLSVSIKGFFYRGVAASTDWVPFDLSRPDLLKCLEIYTQEEANGGMDYTFRDETGAGKSFMNARTALELYHTYGTSPYTKWQTHLFEYAGD